MTGECWEPELLVRLFFSKILKKRGEGGGRGKTHIFPYMQAISTQACLGIGKPPIVKPILLSVVLS